MNALFQWSPLLPLPYMTVLAAGALAVSGLALWKKAPDFYARGLFLTGLILLCANPVIIHETRQALPARLVVVLDESPSQNIAGRNKAAEQILSDIQASLNGMEMVVVRAGQDALSRKNQDTSLFSALRDNLVSIPADQVAGTVLITDGQVHDVPDHLGLLEKFSPLHVILTGKKDEFDRKVTVTAAPKYGMLGQTVTVTIKVDDIGQPPPGPLLLNVRQDGAPGGQHTVLAGEEREYSFKLDHAGQNIFEFSVAAEQGELTTVNNTAAVIVNGIRDRMRVLLVSGMPHIGERAWRDLLKSDPAIDLVHFNILRSPLSFDTTPPKEMALIAFPVEELFEKKIKDFDLIIFDKYAQYGLLQPQYFSNMAAFVKDGGAFLLAMGSDKPEQSLYRTALAGILPIEPKSEKQSILLNAYQPQLTKAGKIHPVTSDIQRDDKPWGGWFSQVDISKTGGQALMTGAQQSPLLIVDKVGEGRVAVLTSDNIWMWSKGINGGGPYTELLRNVAHWLMREPELEEDFIKTAVKGSTIDVFERMSAGEQKPLTMTYPDGREESVTLSAGEKGWRTARIAGEQNGIYRFFNGSKTAFAVIGTAASREFSDVHTTAERLTPVAQKTKGSVIWYAETPRFSLKNLNLKESTAYTVSRVDSVPLVPNWLAVLLIFGGLVAVWRWESGGRKKAL